MGFGCVIMAAFVLLLFAVSIVGGAFRILRQLMADIWNSIADACSRFWRWITTPLRPKPLERQIDDPNYYNPTEEAPKRYDKTDGIVTSFKKVK